MKYCDRFSTVHEVNPTSTQLVMSLNSCFHFRNTIATSTNLKQLAAFMSVARMARSVTVKIHSASGRDGSGVIIKKQGNIYTVLTTYPVVERSGVEYIIHSSKGNDYVATKVIRLQQYESKLNLAVVQFYSPDAYLVATLGQFEDVSSGTEVYMAGYPRTICTERQEFEFTNGLIIGRHKGEFLRYKPPIWNSMSGAPVFNANGQVIGVYVASEVDKQSGTVIQTAVPVNSFISLLNLTELSCSDLSLNLPQTAAGQTLAINFNET